MKKKTSVQFCSNRLVFLFVIVCSSLLLNGTIINIPAEHPTIQEGINASTNGDTVLVYPGTYYENINLNGHHITLASLELTTGNEAYIDSTIINGNQNGNCIKIINEEQDVVIRGFSITNGCEELLFGILNEGAGIVIMTYPFTEISSVSIINCKIFNNTSLGGGGGIRCHNADMILSGVDIYDNYSSSGGGIFANYECNIMFDEINRCNIYNNYAASGSDILVVEAVNDIHVVLGTFTVLEPDGYFAVNRDNPYDEYEMTFDIQNGWLEQIDHDVYVSTTGDDTNSGTSPEEPFRTIAWALHKVVSNSLESNTVHIAPGTYSQDLNNQIFPLGAKANINITGSESEDTILNNNSSLYVVGFRYKENCLIENLIFNNSYENANSVIKFFDCDNVIFNNIVIEDCNLQDRTVFLYDEEGGSFVFDNVIIRNNTAEGCAGIEMPGRVNVSMKNCILDNNHSVGNLDTGWISNFYCYVRDSLRIENCIFSNSSTLREDVSTVGISRSQNFDPKYVIINSAFYNNDTPSDFCIGIGGFSESTKEIINCTFVGNEAASATLAIGGNVNMYNTIMQNNTNHEIYLGDFSSFGNISDVNLSHCNIQGGEASVYNENGVNNVNWLEGNLDEDPLFDTEGDYPFALSELSPCIDAGTLELPDGINLPEFDLAGNPRIYGGAVDMGAYEWSPVDAIHNYELPITNYELKNYPNPFNPSTTISFSISNEQSEQNQQATVKIYNVKGQLVKILMDAQVSPGEFNIIWQGTDNSNKRVASGTYFVKLNVNGEEKSVKKITVVK
jgi:hypothetical protein